MQFNAVMAGADQMKAMVFSLTNLPSTKLLRPLMYNSCGYVWLFNCDQYVIEFQPNEKTRETKFIILDEGRIEIIPRS